VNSNEDAKEPEQRPEFREARVPQLFFTPNISVADFWGERTIRMVIHYPFLAQCLMAAL
jgi:hypothetical protein